MRCRNRFGRQDCGSIHATQQFALEGAVKSAYNIVLRDVLKCFTYIFLVNEGLSKSFCSGLSLCHGCIRRSNAWRWLGWSCLPPGEGNRMIFAPEWRGNHQGWRNNRDEGNINTHDCTLLVKNWDDWKISVLRLYREEREPIIH